MDFILDQTDFSTLLFASLIVNYIGQFCVKKSPDIKTWSEYIAYFLFVLIMGTELLGDGLSDPMEFAVISISAFLTALLIMGLICIFLPLPLYLFQQTVGRGISELKQLQLDRQRKRMKKQQAKEAQAQQLQNRKEWEQNAPKRERQKKEQQQAEQQQIIDQHRREQIRLDCQLLFDQHAQELQERFPYERLMEYFSQYLSDGFPIDIVEQRGTLLQEMIQTTLEQAGENKQRFSSIIEISTYFQEQKKEIELLNYDEPTRQSFICSLNDQENRAIQEFMLS